MKKVRIHLKYDGSVISSSFLKEEEKKKEKEGKRRNKKEKKGKEKKVRFSSSSISSSSTTSSPFLEKKEEKKTSSSSTTSPFLEKKEKKKVEVEDNVREKWIPFFHHSDYKTTDSETVWDSLEKKLEVKCGLAGFLPSNINSVYLYIFGSSQLTKDQEKTFSIHGIEKVSLQYIYDSSSSEEEKEKRPKEENSSSQEKEMEGWLKKTEEGQYVIEFTDLSFFAQLPIIVTFERSF